ncbi:MAG: penicillin-binding protein 2, partial [Planctomycetota bacterium]|nr:penicillin-binding protein 2 [Planctomycetota bacterium]
FREEYRRYYPFGAVASQVLGIVGVDHRGLSGLEASFEDVLTGEKGWRPMWRDGRGRGVLPPGTVAAAPVDGWDVTLTIDPAIQCALEDVLEKIFLAHTPRVAIGVVLDPRTGDILAVAQRPTFDPNRYSMSSPESWRIRAFTDTYEPGSTIKPLIAAACLEEGLAEMDEMIDCEMGTWMIQKRRLRDFHPYGLLPFTGVISKSSNIGMAKLGLRLGPELLRKWVARFELTDKAGLPIPDEGRGRITSASKWNLYSTTSVPMGHEVAVTPIRLACAYAALANGGILRRPRLVSRIEGPWGGKSFSPDAGRRVLSTLVSRGQIGAALVSAVLKGTGRRAALPDVTVAGKTGTAEVIGEGDEVIASFVGYAPAEDPEVLALILVDRPQGKRPTGGIVAAPAVRSVLREALSRPGR